MVARCYEVGRTNNKPPQTKGSYTHSKKLQRKTEKDDGPFDWKALCFVDATAT